MAVLHGVAGRAGGVMETGHEPDDMLREALERYREAVLHDRENMEQAQDDLKFLAGEQWDPEIERRRTADGRPCLTMNRLPQFIRQVTGDMRINTPAITVRPVDNGADPKTAEIYSGLIRNIESVSDADYAYIQAGEHSVACGMGNFRIDTRYTADDAWEQEILIKPIRNPFAVVWDPAAIELTREDARFCFVVDNVERKAFQAMFPDAGMASIDQPVSTDWQDWVSRDTIRVAEYWVKKPVTRTLARLPTGEVLDMSDAPPNVLAEAEAAGAEFRRADGHKVCSYLITANEVLAGPFDWAGRYIPIVPVVGSEIVIGDRTVRFGMVRFAKDPQRSYNYHVSADVEFAALQPKAPWLATVEQIKGLEEEWARANQDNQSVLIYNPDRQAPGPPTRIQPPVPSAAMGMLAAKAADDMKAVTGIYDAALGARSNETSGRAILARQREGDVGSFHYIDNLSKAIAHAGRILVDLIPKIYDSERIVRVLGQDGVAEPARINVQMPDGTLKNDLSTGRYDVVVKAGPSFSTRRDESAQAMMEFMQAYPPAAGAIGDLVADAMDWPGSKEIAARLRATMPPGLAEKAKAEARGEPPPQMEPPPPKPEEIEAQAKATQAQASAMKAQIEVRRMEMGMDLPQGAAPPEPVDPMQQNLAIAEALAKARKAEADAVKAEAEAQKAQIEAQALATEESDKVALPQIVADVMDARLVDPREGAERTAAEVMEQIAAMRASLEATVEQVSKMGADFSKAAKLMAAPKRIKRGADGRAIGVEVEMME